MKRKNVNIIFDSCAVIDIKTMTCIDFFFKFIGNQTINGVGISEDQSKCYISVINEFETKIAIDKSILKELNKLSFDELLKLDIIDSQLCKYIDKTYYLNITDIEDLLECAQEFKNKELVYSEILESKINVLSKPI